MRFFQCLALLATALPAAISSTIPPPENLCKAGAQRCHNNNNLEQCNSHGLFKLIQKCTETEFCTIDSVDPDARGQCLQQDCIQEPCFHSTPLVTRNVQDADAPASCVDGDTHCEGRVMQNCENSNWVFGLICSKPPTCVVVDGIAQCGSPVPPRATSIPEPCNRGDRQCSANAYSLMLCGENRQYRIEKKCTTPGDCKTDGPGQAHCERGGIDPPMFKSVGIECTSGDRACDSNRRYLFQCIEGQWQPLQCYRAGACQIDEEDGQLSCIGFPWYKYPEAENKVCETESSCEFLRYLQCIAGDSDDPKRQAYCLRKMCSNKDVSTLPF